MRSQRNKSYLPFVVMPKRINLVIIACFVFIAVIYIRNLSQDIYGGDVGDFVTAAYLFGVPHPSGYPLFTILGAFLSHLPLPLPIVARVGLISVFASVASLYFFYKIAYDASKSSIISLLSTSILAFSYLFWLYAEIPEVFALNIFFTVILFYFAIQFYKRAQAKYLYFLAFFSMLAMTNHHTIVFIFPSLFILISKHLNYVLANKRRIILTAFYALIGLIPYVYIPIAASKNPIISWDNAVNLQNFIRLFLRQDYGGIPLAGASKLVFSYKLLLLKDYFSELINMFTLPFFCLGLFGIFKLFRLNKRLFLSLFLAVFLSGPFFLYYATPSVSDTFWLGIIERFYLLSTVLFLFFVPYGLVVYREIIIKILPRKNYSVFFLMVLFVVPGILFYFNLEQTNLSQAKIGNNLGRDILMSSPKNSILFLGGDTTTFNTWYMQYVEGYRKDVLLINSPFVSRQSAKNLKREANEYFKTHSYKEFSVGKFSLDISALEKTKKKPILFMWPIDVNDKITLWIPRGMLYELSDSDHIPKEQEYLLDTKKVWDRMNIPYRNKLSLSEKGLTVAQIPRKYSESLVETGKFIYSSYHDLKTAVGFYKNAIAVDSTNAEAYDYLAIAKYLQFDCKSSGEYINNAIGNSVINEEARRYYMHAYLIYKNCNNNKMLNIAEKEYYSRFKKNIISEYDMFSKNAVEVVKKSMKDK